MKRVFRVNLGGRKKVSGKEKRITSDEEGESRR
jgi:hypothetical protein